MLNLKKNTHRCRMNIGFVWSVSILILFASLVTSFDICSTVGQALSTTRRVPIDYPTIQAGIDAAVPGDLVLVDSGIYFENVIINKTVSLLGQNKETTIIDGNGIGNVVVIAAGHVNLSGFTVRRSGQKLQDSGIFLDFRSVGSKISDNIVVNNYHGIFLESSTGNAISFNNVSLNTGRGINLVSSSGNVVYSNFVSRNEQDNGIELFDSAGNIITANIFSRNGWSGIYLRESSGNIIRENTVSNNSETGVYFDASSNSILYRNNFLYNGLTELGQLFSADSLNTWDNGAEGNYWSDYTGSDLNGDGIGDTGTIPHLGVDSKPLMEPWSHLRVFHIDDSVVTVVGNSTIARFSFIQLQAEIHFNVTGASNTLSFCNVTIPKKLLNSSYPRTWTVVIDGVYFSHAVIENMTHTSIYFTFTHSTRQVKIQVVELPNLPPTADFTYIPIVPTPYDTVNFTDSSTDDDGIIVSWQWEFGDGSSSTEQRPRHKYAIAGVYPVTLKVSDDRGNSTLTSKAVSVRKIGTSAIVDAPSKVNRGELFRMTVNLQDESQNPLPNVTIWVYILKEKWDAAGHDETNASGIASVEYTPALISGAYLFKAVFNGTQIFAESSNIFQIEIESPDGAPPSTSLLDEPLLRIGVICVIIGVAVALIILWRRRRIAHSLEDVKKGTR
jgi:parallel beta-helix repeat protein